MYHLWGYKHLSQDKRLFQTMKDKPTFSFHIATAQYEWIGGEGFEKFEDAANEYTRCKKLFESKKNSQPTQPKPMSSQMDSILSEDMGKK